MNIKEKIRGARFYKRCDNLLDKFRTAKKLKSYLKRKHGYSLLEVIFVFIVIGVAFIVISKVKDDIFSSQDMNNTKQSVEFLAANITGAYAGSKYTDLDTQKVIEMGLVPKVMNIKNNSKIIHPLKGEVEIEKGNNGDSFIITLKGLSNETCLQLETSSGERWAEVEAHCGSNSKSNSISFENY